MDILQTQAVMFKLLLMLVLIYLVIFVLIAVFITLMAPQTHLWHGVRVSLVQKLGTFIMPVARLGGTQQIVITQAEWVVTVREVVIRIPNTTMFKMHGVFQD